MQTDTRSVATLTRDTSTLLDLIRALAVQMVVVGHTFWFTDAVLTDATHVTKYPALLFIPKLAVVMFFILSGLLISYTAIRHRGRAGYSFSSYFVDRFARIYTGLIPAMALIAVIDVLHYRLNAGHFLMYLGRSPSLGTFAGSLLMLQGYPLLDWSTFGDAFPLWTLSIEWWLYLFFGWVALRKRPDRGLGNWLGFGLPLAVFAVVPVQRMFFMNEDLIFAWFAGVAIMLMLAKSQFASRRVGWGGAAVLTLIVLLRSSRPTVNV